MLWLPTETHHAPGWFSVLGAVFHRFQEVPSLSASLSRIAWGRCRYPDTPSAAPVSIRKIRHVARWRRIPR
jgi:hypothetical protein